jgi:hypothetical protein
VLVRGFPRRAGGYMGEDIVIRLWYVGALVFCACSASVALGDDVAYTIDPTRSSIAVSGTWGSIPFIAVPEVEGVIPDNDPLTTSYTGSISANRDFGLGTLQLTGGSISAEDNGAYLPSLQPGNYGFASSLAFSQWVAVRDFVFSLSSPFITSPSSFDSSTISAGIHSGQVDYTLINYLSRPQNEDDSSVSFVGPLPLATGTAFLIDNGNIETLTIPIETDLEIQANDRPLALHFSGEIVATATVPEPGSFWWVGFVVPLFLGRRGLWRI